MRHHHETDQTSEKIVYLDVDSAVHQKILAELVSGVEFALQDDQILTICDVVEVYQTRMEELGQADDRDYRTLRKMMERKLNKQIPDISLDKSTPNKCQRQTP